MSSQTLALLKLTLAGGPVMPRRTLLETHAEPARCLADGATAWRAAGLTCTQRQRLRQPDEETLQRAIRWLEHPRHHLIGWHDADYPALLKQAANPPLALFVDGDPSLLWHAGVAVVGSRSPTAGGRDNASAFARALALSGVAVISGMATGIDAAAHQAALVHDGVTVAVLGTGPDIAYPRSNTMLRARIAERGAVVSEHPPGTGARPGHFPSRNRILAGLALGTLVVEATERSGALITARLAAENGREVFAVPGSIHNPMARGCHRLIRDGACLVDSAAEVLAALAPVARELACALRGRLEEAASVPHVHARGACSPLAPDHQQVWLALAHDPTDMDVLIQRTG